MINWEFEILVDDIDGTSIWRKSKIEKPTLIALYPNIRWQGKVTDNSGREHIFVLEFGDENTIRIRDKNFKILVHTPNSNAMLIHAFDYCERHYIKVRRI